MHRSFGFRWRSHMRRTCLLFHAAPTSNLWVFHQVSSLLPIIVHEAIYLYIALLPSWLAGSSPREAQYAPHACCPLHPHLSLASYTGFYFSLFLSPFCCGYWNHYIRMERAIISRTCDVLANAFGHLLHFTSSILRLVCPPNTSPIRLITLSCHIFLQTAWHCLFITHQKHVLLGLDFLCQTNEHVPHVSSSNCSVSLPRPSIITL